MHCSYHRLLHTLRLSDIYTQIYTRAHTHTHGNTLIDIWSTCCQHLLLKPKTYSSTWPFVCVDDGEVFGQVRALTSGIDALSDPRQVCRHTGTHGQMRILTSPIV